MAGIDDFPQFNDLPASFKYRFVSYLSVRDLAQASLSCKELCAIIQPLLWRTYSCNACGNRLFRPHDVIRNSSDVCLNDGDAYRVSGEFPPSLSTLAKQTSHGVTARLYHVPLGVIILNARSYGTTFVLGSQAGTLDWCLEMWLRWVASMDFSEHA